MKIKELISWLEKQNQELDVYVLEKVCHEDYDGVDCITTYEYEPCKFHANYQELYSYGNDIWGSYILLGSNPDD